MYTAYVTRYTPALFVLLIDQSGSMEEMATIDRYPISKADHVAMTVNSFLSELVNRCRREEGVRDYFHIVAIGYSDGEIYPLLSDDFTPVTPSKLDTLPRDIRYHMRERRLANGKTVIGRYAETMWISPRAAGKTPMNAALRKAAGIVERWCEKPQHSACYPPVIMNITDGVASDAGAEELNRSATRIRNAATEDGNALLISIHITAASQTPGILFPRSPEELPELAKARLLYEMSSIMPEIYEDRIEQLRGTKSVATNGQFRGVSYNTPLTEVISMMNIGSVSVQLIE